MASSKHPSFWAEQHAGAKAAAGGPVGAPEADPVEVSAGPAGLSRTDVSVLTQALPLLELAMRHGRKQVKFYESHLPLSRASYFRLKRECVRAGWLHQSPCRRFIEPVPREIRAALRFAFPMVMAALELPPAAFFGAEAHP